MTPFFNYYFPSISVAVPKTDFCITIDSTVVEAFVSIAALCMIIVATNQGVIGGEDAKLAFFTWMGYIATKFFGISGGNNNGGGERS
jgi:hypothetical protein